MSEVPVNVGHCACYVCAERNDDVENARVDRTIHGGDRAREPTSETYLDLAWAYRFFNARLFDGNLPACMITLQRKHGAAGYFSADRFGLRESEGVFDEIALNPTYFANRSVKDILAVLVHEMCHLWQRHYGKPGRGRYHNREWARKMLDLGLVPSHSGEPGGRQTGDRVSHYVRENGAFDATCNQLLATGSGVTYVELQDGRITAERGRKRASKTTYRCENCSARVWGKPEMRVRCGDCDLLMIESR